MKLIKKLFERFLFRNVSKSIMDAIAWEENRLKTSMSISQKRQFIAELEAAAEFFANPNVPPKQGLIVVKHPNK